MSADWKQVHADIATKAIKHKLVEDAIEELMFNLNLEDDGLPAYGIRKVASIAAQVARAEALGIHPDWLRLSTDEANSQLLEIAARAALSGVPVHMLEVGDVAGDG